MTLAIGIILVIVALVLIVTVLMQDPEQNGMNALTGAAENFFGKKKAKGLDAKLALVTKICAAVFVALCILLMFIPQGTTTAPATEIEEVAEDAGELLEDAAADVAEDAAEALEEAAETVEGATQE